MKTERKISGKAAIIRAAIIVMSLAALVGALCIGLPISASSTIEKSELVDHLMDSATSFVVVYHKQLGGSHYAYTEGLAEELCDGNVSSEGNEATFRPGSKMTLITLSEKDGKIEKDEKVLVNAKNGVIRDPDVSSDGTKIVFSMKKTQNDDYHLYIYDLTTEKTTQLTFGNGQADIEPVFTADGGIIFNSTRDTQTVDCWITPVSNLYKCDADGGNIIRLGYDQVHTTYPTTASDGRVIYTRWDYNDRTQMYVQAVFQMFEDGTGQTELFGNDANNPTTLLHTREIEGSPGKYFSIVCGHHIYQCGKLALVDTTKGRNDKSSLTYIWPDSATKQLSQSESNDTSYFQEGRVYKFPYAISESELLVSTAESYNGSDTAFDIVLMNTEGQSVTIAKGSSSYPASQIVPIKASSRFARASSVDYSSDVGTYYVANVYEGQEGIAAGSAKYLRVVGLEFRSSAIGATVGRGTGTSDPYSPISTGNGAWDVKRVLGIVPVCSDGSVLFSVPAETPVYFQLLDEQGDVIQTMRSWSTLQPGETFSCVGCHLDKNYAPIASSGVTEAMKKGVQTLQKDLWMENYEEYDDLDPYSGTLIGFDYLSVVQPILDKSCVSCHGDTSAAYAEINAGILTCDDGSAANSPLPARDSWYYTDGSVGKNWTTASLDGNWSRASAPFGLSGSAPGSLNTIVDAAEIHLRKTINLTEYDLENCNLKLESVYTGKIEIFVGGVSIYSGSGSLAGYQSITLSQKAKSAFKVGDNEIAVSLTANGNYSYFDLSITTSPAGSGEGGELAQTKLFERGSLWKYFTSATEDLSTSISGDWATANFDNSSWKSANAPLGNRLVAQTTDWTADGKNYLWARKTFNVDDPAKLGQSLVLKLDTFYDDTCYIYLNGVRLHADERWTDDYVTLEFSIADGVIKKGKNVIAISLHQHDGGYEFDMSAEIVEVVEGSNISLEGVGVLADRMKKTFPLSYLVLTGTKAERHGSGTYQFVGSSVNKYTSWVSSMSKCEMLTPYEYGAHDSALIERLRSGHGGLSDTEIRAIACWIDLGAPCYGSYDAGAVWSSNDRREYDEELNKRNYYDMLDKYAKLSLAGALEGKELTVTYKPSTGKELSASGDTIVTLYTSTAYKNGDTVKITLPEGEHYLALTLSSRVGESILYTESSEITLTLQSLEKCFPNTLNPSSGVVYKQNAITVRLVGADELAEKHDLARNSYDTSATTGVYPHASSSAVKDGADISAARNIIDGFYANKGTGGYPNQAWQPQSVDGGTKLCIDFGREVTVDELAITLRRADSDGWFNRCTLTFSDGSSMKLDLSDSDGAQSINIGGKTTESLTFTDFEATGIAAITEIEVLGSEIKK